MRTLLSTWILAGCAASMAPAQQATTHHHFDLDRPGTGVDARDSRYPPALPEDRWAFREKTPEFSGSIPSGPRPRVAVTYDVASGVETRFEAPRGGFAPSGSVTGRVVGEVVSEMLGRSFGQLSSESSTSFPYSTMGRQWFTMTSGSYVCSGTMIDAQTYLTAGHCVHDKDDGGWATGVSFTPAYDGTDDAYGSANATTLGTWGTWIASKTWDGDMGWVRVDRPVGFLAGWLGYGYDSSDTWWETTSFITTGYPGASWPGAPSALYLGTGTWDDVDTYVVKADCPPWTYWYGGMSGGGVYTINTAGDRIVYADNSHGTGSASNTTTDFGVCRMTSAKFDYTKDTFIAGGYTARADYLPLDVNADPGITLTPGDPLLSLDYLVAHRSTGDPASRTFSVEVYLSDDANIDPVGDTLIQTHSFTYDFGPIDSVRVTATTPPTIPVGTRLGDHYLGVRIDVLDADGSNNETDDWDAVKITVSSPDPFYWPHLPTSFKPVLGGYREDFDGLSGVVPSHMAVNELVLATRYDHEDGWCNLGQKAANVEANSGDFALEMGLEPGVFVSDEADIGLILGLDGTGAGSLKLDFVSRNYGFHLGTGIWISKDGASWTSISAGAGGPFKNRWHCENAVFLDGHGVDTDGTFYLLFQLKTYYEFSTTGLTGGTAYDDIQIHAGELPTMFMNNLGEVNTSYSTTIKIENCSPGLPVGLARSLTGGGPTATAWGTGFLTAPWTVIPMPPADLGGTATLSIIGPPGSEGVEFWIQGLDLTKGILTNPLNVVIE